MVEASQLILQNNPEKKKVVTRPELVIFIVPLLLGDHKIRVFFMGFADLALVWTSKRILNNLHIHFMQFPSVFFAHVFREVNEELNEPSKSGEGIFIFTILMS